LIVGAEIDRDDGIAYDSLSRGPRISVAGG
jgi:hypothetical protein